MSHKGEDQRDESSMPPSWPLWNIILSHSASSLAIGQ